MTKDEGQNKRVKLISIKRTEHAIGVVATLGDRVLATSAEEGWKEVAGWKAMPETGTFWYKVKGKIKGFSGELVHSADISKKDYDKFVELIIAKSKCEGESDAIGDLLRYGSGDKFLVSIIGSKKCLQIFPEAKQVELERLTVELEKLPDGSSNYTFYPWRKCLDLAGKLNGYKEVCKVTRDFLNKSSQHKNSFSKTFRDFVDSYGLTVNRQYGQLLGETALIKIAR